MTRPIAPDSVDAVSAALPTRANYHPARKLFHFATGGLFALLNLNLSPPVARALFTGLFATVFVVEALRIRAPAGRLNKAVLTAFRPFIRAHETHQFAGIAYYTAGVALTAAAFARAPACLGMLALATADPAAAAAATFFAPRLSALPRLPHGKSLAGPVCGALAAALVLYPVLRAAAPSSSLLPADAFMLAVLVAWVAAVTEFAVPSPQLIFGPKHLPLGVDDNALIPLAAAAACQWILTVTQHKLELAPFLLWGASS